MENSNTTSPLRYVKTHGFFVLGTIFLGILFFIFLLSLLLPRATKRLPSSPIPTPVIVISDKNVSVLQKTSIGQMLPANFKDSVTIEKIDARSNNEIVYSFTAPVAIRPNQVITKNNMVVFERILTPETQSAPGFATLSEYKTHFGAAEQEIQGSKLYGWYINAYIYASKGLTILGNPSTDEIYEIQHYLPMSVEEYIKTYGEDLDPNAQPPHE